MSYQCSRCNSDMEKGFLLEKGDGGILSSQTWVAGKADQSFLSRVRLKGKMVYNITTFRCTA